MTNSRARYLLPRATGQRAIGQWAIGRRPVYALLACLLGNGGLLCGCGKKSEIERVVLSGDVMFGGQRVEYGDIRFIPTKESASKVPQTIALIKEGRYDTSPSQGVPVGTHRVVIKGYKGEDYKNHRPGPFAPPIGQILPKKYNEESTLTLELPPGSESSRDYPFMLDP